MIEAHALTNVELAGHREPALVDPSDPEPPIYGIDFPPPAVNLTTGAGTTATAVTATGFQL
jgi:hypothetical protein